MFRFGFCDFSIVWFIFWGFLFFKWFVVLLEVDRLCGIFFLDLFYFWVWGVGIFCFGGWGMVLGVVKLIFFFVRFRSGLGISVDLVDFELVFLIF